MIGLHIPLKECIDWLAGLVPVLIIELVTRDDPMVQTLSRNKVDHYADYHLDYFERCLHDVFDFRQRQILDRGIRFLYYSASKKGG